MKISVRQIILAFWLSAIAFVILVTVLVLSLHRKESQRAVVSPALTSDYSAQSISLQRLVPPSASIALFARSPQAAFDSWAIASRYFYGEDTASAWLASSFGDNVAFLDALARYSISADAPLAVVLELSPQERQFQTHFAVVLKCSDPASFAKTAWPADPNAPSSTRLFAKREGYSLAFHGTLVCASWQGWIAVSDSADLASSVAETFLHSGAVWSQSVFHEETAVALLYPSRLRSVWKPLTAWFRVAWPPYSTRLASVCEVLEPAVADPGPVVLRTLVSGDAVAANFAWSATDCPALTAMLGDPALNTPDGLQPNSESLLTGAFALNGLLGASCKQQIQQLADATRDPDVIEAVAGVANTMTTSLTFEMGPVDEEEAMFYVAWNTSDAAATEKGLATIFPAVRGADSATNDGTVIHATRIIQPVYFAVSHGIAAIAADANDVREVLTSRQAPAQDAAVSRRLNVHLRGAHLVQSLEQLKWPWLWDRQDALCSALSNMATADVSWTVADSVESIAFQIRFNASSSTATDTRADAGTDN